MSTEKNTHQAKYDEELKARGKRIEALRTVEMPGSGPRSGFSHRIAAVEKTYRNAGSEFVRFTSTPESAEDWKKLRARLDEALEQMDADLDALEKDRSAAKS